MGVILTMPAGPGRVAKPVEELEHERQELRRRTHAALAEARAELTGLARQGRGGRAAQARYAAQLDEIVRETIMEA